jgi:NTE family protein
MVRELAKTRDFQTIRGVSVGAINGAFLAQAPVRGDSHAALQHQAAALEHVWSELGEGLSKLAHGAPSTDGVARMEMMGAALKQLIDSAIRRDILLASKRDFTAGYVSLLTGRYMEAGARRADVLDLVRASAALPPLFPCVKTTEDLLVDGGYRNITPLASAFKSRNPPDEIYVLVTRRIASRSGRLLNCAIEPQPLDPDWASRDGDPHKLYAQVAARLVDILMDEVYIEDIKRAIQVNSLARMLDDIERRQGRRAASSLSRYALGTNGHRPRYVKLYVIAPRRRFNPDAPPGHGDDLAAFDPRLIRDAIEHGAKVAADEKKWAWHPGLENTKADFR